MAGRSTNLALMGLLVVALATGALAYAIGTSAAAVVVVAHGVAGLAIVVLAPWNGAIARRGLRRRHQGNAISLLLAGLVIACVVAGVVHATGLLDVKDPLSPLGIHVATGLAAVAVGVAHVVQRPVRPRVIDLSRRNLLRGLVLAAGGGRGVRESRSFAARHRCPRCRPTVHRFPRGRIVRPGRYASDPVARRQRALDRRLVVAGGDRGRRPRDAVVSVSVRSATGYARRFPLGAAPAMLLATKVGGQVLSAGHGFPARLVVPGRRGFWWVKWVTEIRVEDAPWWWQPPFPVT